MDDDSLHVKKGVKTVCNRFRLRRCLLDVWPVFRASAVDNPLKQALVVKPPDKKYAIARAHIDGTGEKSKKIKSSRVNKTNERRSSLRVLVKRSVDYGKA